MQAHSKNEFLKQALPLLLHDHDCLVVPGLGGFVAHPIPARFDADKGEWVPPGRDVAFNAKLTIRDGLLEQEIRRATGCTNDAASALIDGEVQRLREIIENGGTETIPGLGRMYLNASGQVGFAPESRLGERYAPPGLSRIPWVEFSQEKKATTAPPTEAPTPASETVGPTPIEGQDVAATSVSVTLLRLAAVIALPLLVGGTLWWGKSNQDEFRFALPGAALESPYLPRIDGEDIRFPETENVESLAFLDADAPAIEPVPTEAVMPLPSSQPISSGCAHHVIAGTFSNMARAAGLARRFESLGYSTSILPGPNGQHRVSAGCFHDASQARAFRRGLDEHHGLGQAWILKQ